MSDIQLGAGGNVPIIDFGPFLDGSNKQGVADALLRSFKDIGFVYLINHGLSKDKIEEMFKVSKTFFDQPDETKQLAPHPASGAHHRGWSAPGREQVAHDSKDDKKTRVRQQAAVDLKESFEVGREDDAAQPNIWLPDGVLPGFKETCLDYYWTCNETKFKILSAIAVALHLPENYFDEYHQAADNQLRLLHYPSVPLADIENDKIIRIGSHSDFCSITILVQDDVGGLEVEDPNKPGEFQAVPPVKDSIVVNAGDFLMRWSNDLIRSTIHRVRAPMNAKITEGTQTPDRYSIVFFVATDLTKTVDCLPGTFSEDNPKKYEPVSALDYIMSRLAANY